MATPVYMLLGHGNEEVVEYDARLPVPEGYTVVLLSFPGQPLSTYEADRVWGVMASNPDLFRNPVENRVEIRKQTGIQMRIYEAGIPCPEMRYYPEGSMDLRGSYGQIAGKRYYPAGMYTLPVPFPSLDNQVYTGSYSLPISQIPTLYSGDLNERIRTRLLELPVVNDSIPIASLKSVEYPIHDVLTFAGPGIYYFFNCRYVKGLNDRFQAFIHQIVTDLKALKSVETYEEIQSIVDILVLQLERLKADGRKPEDKLSVLRSLLLPGSGLPGDPNEFYATNEDITEWLEVPHDSEAKLMDLKRRYVRLFDADFGELQRRLGLIRVASQRLQNERYPYPTTRKGGRRKKRRSTRHKRRKISRKNLK
jgi:hypothetical protein